MADTSDPSGPDASELRQRLTTNADTPQRGLTEETAESVVRKLNQERDARGVKDEKDRRTYGRTPDGTGEYFQCSPRRDVERTCVVAIDRCNGTYPCLCRRSTQFTLFLRSTDPSIV